MPSTLPPLKLAHGLAFADLYSTDGAARIDGLFVAHLREADAALAPAFAAARASRPHSRERTSRSF